MGKDNSRNTAIQEKLVSDVNDLPWFQEVLKISQKVLDNTPDESLPVWYKNVYLKNHPVVQQNRDNKDLHLDYVDLGKLKALYVNGELVKHGRNISVTHLLPIIGEQKIGDIKMWAIEDENVFLEDVFSYYDKKFLIAK